MRSLRLVAALSCMLIRTIAYAQQSPAPDSVPRAGEWAAEMSFGSAYSGASLLRFWSPKFALLLGADFNVSHHEVESSLPTTNVPSGTFGSLGARLGVRSYRQSPTARLRPVIGIGARATLSKWSPESHSWSTGIYGELGAVYFVAPHLSLGGTAELQASYVKERQGGSGFWFETTSTSVGGSLARLLVSVYF